VELTNGLRLDLYNVSPDPEDGRQILIRLKARVAHRNELREKGPELSKAMRAILRGSCASHSA
jgi:hypothetical protein